MRVEHHHPIIEGLRLIVRRHADALDLESHHTAVNPDTGSDQWCEDYFLTIAWFESHATWHARNLRAYPDDPYRQASGFYQHMPMYWAGHGDIDGNSAGVRRAQWAASAFEVAGFSRPWMDHALRDAELPVYRTWPPIRQKRVGIFGEANIGVAVWLWTQQGYGAWSVTSPTNPGLTGIEPAAWDSRNCGFVVEIQRYYRGELVR